MDATLTQSVLSGTLYEHQINLETRSTRDGVRMYREQVAHAIRRGEAGQLKSAERLLLYWFTDLRRAVRRELRGIRNGEHAPNPGYLPVKGPRGRGVYGPVLLCLDPDRLAVLTLHTAVDHCLLNPLGVKFTKVAYEIGAAIYAEINLEMLTADGPELMRALTERVRRITVKNVNWHAKRTLEDPAWSKRVAIHAGAWLLWALLNTSSVPDKKGEPTGAFYKHLQRRGRKTTGLLWMTRRAHELIDDGNEARGRLRPLYRPMVVPPTKWAKGGRGYMRLHAPLVGKLTQTQREALDRADLQPTFECIDALNSQDWDQQAEIVGTVRAVWRQGGGILHLPSRVDTPKPTRLPECDHDEEADLRFRREAVRIRKNNIRLKGERKTTELVLNEFSIFERYERFWFPHRLDFRLRNYPRPQYMNHQIGDMLRGCLRFATPAPMTDRGYAWLKIHAANCYGLDKVSFNARIAWVDANWELLMECARSPLKTDFWHNADKPRDPNEWGAPWQFLAACKALERPEEDGACLPVQIDGSNNGFQHYAALALDEKSARAVNMTPATWNDDPEDSYGDVFRVAQPVVGRLAAGGHHAASLVADILSRALIKQPVMTEGYNVTDSGMFKQLRLGLAKLGVPREHVRECALFLVQIVRDSSSEVCRALAVVRDWLEACANPIVAKGYHIEFESEILRFPVVQPYRRYEKKEIRTLAGSLHTLLEEESAKIRVRKHRQAFPPNFIHSLDATHMLITARDCRARGLNFAGVHDSYWTSAAQVDAMRTIIDDGFIEIHTPNVMQRLHDGLSRRYPDVEFPPPPPRGDFDLAGNLRRAPYAFH